jgi:hypothetical protein
MLRFGKRWLRSISIPGFMQKAPSLLNPTTVRCREPGEARLMEASRWNTG